jgi:ubiquinone/menaquinone biosynthesis C-methylase UbiE
MSLPESERAAQNARRKKAWGKQAANYDKQIGFFERRVLGDHRSWACEQATGRVLEVAVGTGLNLPLYAHDVDVTGIDLSPEMLAIARKRAIDLGRTLDLREGDAHELPFGNDTFDTVVCTYSLCNIPDIERAVGEMKRVLKPGGRLVLVDHVRSTSKVVLAIQKAIEFVSLRVDGDHMTRRPIDQVRGAGFDVQLSERSRAGIVERVVATKP